MINSLRSGSEPFFIRGGTQVGVLLIHGFTGISNDMRPIGERLNADGFTALSVRLTHHGTHGEDMNRSRWHDWYTAALDGYQLLRDQCERVFVMGLSMGGVLALHLAAHEIVAGVVTMSSPSYLYYQKAGWRARYANLYGMIFRFVPKENPDGWHEIQSYPVFPTLAVQQFFDLLKANDAVLPKVTAPVLLIHSHGDTFIPGDNMQHFYERLTNAPRETFWLEKSEHVVTKDVELDILLNRIQAFVRGNTRLTDGSGLHD